MSLIVVPAEENKDTLKKYEELWTKIRDLIRSKTNNSDDYDENYMKTKFNSKWWFVSWENTKIFQHDNSC